jgi:hypothetical protein
VNTGNATLRIVQPSVEGEGYTPKLKSMMALPNNIVAELVQAGFSEETIVRRTKNSSVAFDCSSKKIEDLHRHHVRVQVSNRFFVVSTRRGYCATGSRAPETRNCVFPVCFPFCLFQGHLLPTLQ